MQVIVQTHETNLCVRGSGGRGRGVFSFWLVLYNRRPMFGAMPMLSLRVVFAEKNLWICGPNTRHRTQTVSARSACNIRKAAKHLLDNDHKSPESSSTTCMTGVDFNHDHPRLHNVFHSHYRHCLSVVPSESNGCTETYRNTKEALFI